MQGAVGGGAVGAIVSPYVSQRSDRRTARAKAREKLAEAENARRASGETFDEITIQLRTAAMIAGAPRSVVEKYISTAENFRKCGLDEKTGKNAQLDPSAPQNWSGFLNTDTVMVASVLSALLWHPWAGRIFVGFRLRFKLWTWRRRIMVMAVQSALLHYTEKGKEPFPFDDDSVVLLHYCYEHLPRHLRSGIPLRSRLGQRFRRGLAASKMEAVASSAASDSVSAPG